MQNRKRKRKQQVLSPEQIYDKGVNILNRLLTTDLKTLPHEVLIKQYQLAENYINAAIQKYKDCNDEVNVKATYEILAVFFEKHIADRLVDQAIEFVLEEEFAEAIFYYELANTYYSKTVNLKDYSKTPELDLHFSILLVLKKLMKIDFPNQAQYRQKIADYMSEYQIESQVNVVSEKARDYQEWTNSYQQITGHKRRTVAEVRQPEAHTEVNQSVKLIRMFAVVQAQAQKESEEIKQSFWATINARIVDDDLNKFAVSQWLLAIADIYAFNSKMKLACIPMNASKKRETIMNFYKQASELGNGDAAVRLQEYNISSFLSSNIFFARRPTHRYDSSFVKKYVRNNFDTLGPVEYLRQVLNKHVEDILRSCHMQQAQTILICLSQCIANKIFANTGVQPQLAHV